MSFGPVIDVAVGITLIYLSLSLFATTIQELIAALLKTRARQLRATLSQTLSDLGTVNYNDPRFVAIYNHSLVAGMSRKQLPSYVPGRNIAIAISEYLNNGTTFNPAAMMATINAIPNMHLRQALSTFSNRGAGIEAQFQKELEKWFDDMMNRLSGEYKRYSQYTMFIIGLILAISLNVSTFNAASILWSDSQLRDQLVKQAAHYAPPAKDGSQSDVSAGSKNLSSAAGDLASLPIGWKSSNILIDKPAWQWTISILGWIVTAFAVSLGSNFWFDNLQKLMNFRNTGPKSAQEAEKRKT